VVDLGFTTLTGRIDVGNAPQDVALAPDGRTLYVSWWELQQTGAGELLVVDPAAGTITNRIGVGAFAQDVRWRGRGSPCRPGRIAWWPIRPAATGTT